MITPYQILKESGFAQYTAMVRFHYNRENTSLGAEKIAEMVRAIPGATRVSTVSLDKEHGIGIFNVKIISQKPPKEAYQALKQNALNRYRGLITGVEVGANTIETKGDFILKENLRNLSNSNLGQYIGQLLEEGLLLEVSIDELRRQWVESGKMDEETFNQIVQASNNQSNYATWLVKKVASDIISTEDLHLWSEIFTFFDRYKQRFQKKDINQVKTREDCTEFMNDYNRIKDAVENQKSSGMSKSDAEKTDPCLLGKFKTSDGRKWTVYKTTPGQWQEERKIGSGTGWCTVASLQFFNRYFQGDPNPAYYIFINQKDPKEKYQIHYNSDQFKDKNDREVDREEDWALEFFEYLKERDGRTELPPRTKEAIQKKKNRKASIEDLQQETRSVAPSLRISEDNGNTAYKLDQDSDILGKGSVMDIAKLFVEVLSLSENEALRFAERISNWRQPGCLLKLSDGSFDILQRTYRHELGSTPDCRPYNQNTDLPKATEDNIRIYTDAADYLGASINQEVIVRTDKDLPSLDEFLVKSEGNQKVYRVGPTRRFYKALLQAGIGRYTLTLISGDVLIYEGPVMPPSWTNRYVCVNAETGSLIGSAYLSDTPDELDTLYRFYENLKKLGFDFITGAKHSPDRGLNRAIFWHNQGGLEGIKQKIQAEAEDAPEGFPQGSKVGKSNTIKAVLELWNTIIVGESVGFFTTDFNKYLIAFNNGIYQWDLDNQNHIAIIPAISSQKDIRESKVEPELLARFCQYSGIELPPALEKILARSQNRTYNITSVLKLLRHGLQQNSLRQVSLPIYRDRRNGHPYRVSTMDGMYGTWEQIGPAIRESSPQRWSDIQTAIQNHPGATVDALIYFHLDSPRHTWNCVVRIIENNTVVWYARRWGNGEGAQWNMRDVPEDIRVTVEGEPIQNNYSAPEPPAPRRAARQPRQAQAAQAAQAAAPAPELTPEQQQQIQQSRIQTQNAEEAYRFDVQHAQQGLAALGFTNISQELAGQPNNMVQAVVYRVHPHRGNTTHVALLYANNANTVVAGYPQNPTLAVAEGCSQAWRRLTQQLDNSVRTFQQCHDICQELHIPIPPAIQGWLVYRGQ